MYIFSLISFNALFQLPFAILSFSPFLLCIRFGWLVSLSLAFEAAWARLAQSFNGPSLHTQQSRCNAERYVR